MIRSVSIILCRTLLSVLDDRGISTCAVAQSTFILIVDLRRALEFGSPLDDEAAKRLIAWATRVVVVVSLPRKKAMLPNRISGGRIQAQAMM